MKASADPMLLSLLEKIANPLTELDLTITLKGVFAPSQQWKQSDEANPNIFTYSLQIFDNSFSSGKIEPRKLTEKEIKEQEQAKNKKASKKQAKQQQKPQQVDPDAQKKRLEWQALSQEEKFYRTQQDPFKAFSLKWAESKKQQHIDGDHLHKFEDAVSNGSLDLILIRKPEGGQQEIAKLKKAKAKGLNLGELYSAKYKGSMNLKQLNTPGSVSITQRIPIAFSGELPAECIRIDCDKCYALVEVTLSQPINPLVKQEKPSARQLLGESSKEQASGNLLGKLKEEIRKGMRAISQQYSLYFVKEKDHTSDDRKMNTSNNTNFLSVSTLRINEISKRKEQFLTEFASSGKYATLRDRIAKTVKAIVVDRCRKEKAGGAISKEQLHRTLSELNVFLREMVEKILDESVSTQATTLHEDIVLGHQYTKGGRKQALTGVSESCEEREERLAQQYEIINKIEQAEAKFLNLTIIQNYSLYALQAYAKFCLRYGYYDKAYALYRRVASQSSQFRHQLIICLFKAHRNRQNEAITQALQLAEGQGSAEQKAIVHELLSFLHERVGEEKKAEKHLALAQKYYQIKNNPNLKVNPPKNPYLEPIPRIPKPGKYVSQLSQHESQQLRFSLVGYFIDHSFFGLVKDYLPKLADSDRKKQIEALVLVSQKQFDQAVALVETLLQKDPKNMDLLLLKAQICFKSQKLFECQEVFLYLLRLKPYPVQSYAIYLRLALTYLQRKSWQDSKATFNKAVQLKPNSAAGWFGLGIANLRLSLLKQSEEAFNLSSIYNPLSKEPQQYLQQISAQVNKEQQAAYPYLQKAES